MKIIIDTDAHQLIADAGTDEERTLPLYEDDALAVLGCHWLKAGWNCKYSYDFEWCGRRIIQMPDDIVRLQELVWATRPTVIVETGIAHGGSTVLFASLLKLTGGRRVISVDIEIRPHNRAALDAHPFIDMCTLIEQSSVEPGVLDAIHSALEPEDRVMVVLDSSHTKDHVAKELELYAPLVTPGCYAVVADGIMQLVADVPRGKPEWLDNNPMEAAKEFLATHPEFTLDESYTRTGITYFQGGYLRREDV